MGRCYPGRGGTNWLAVIGARIVIVSDGAESVSAIYDRIAEAFESHAADGLYNAHLDRPSVLELCGDVAGLDVLDAGCGPGLYAAALLDRGARTVTCFDASAEMVRLTGTRVGGRATVLQHDANEPMSWLDDESTDVTVCALMVHYVDDRAGFFGEIHRVLRPGGAFVLSTQHPTTDWIRHGGSYFATERVTEPWHVAGVQMPFWRQPLTALCAELSDAGFVIDRLVEPVPVESGATIDAEEHAKLHTEPSFLVMRLIRR